MRKYFTFLIGMMVSLSAADAQGLIEKWKVTLASDGNNDVAHQIYQSVNGDLVVVGETWSDKGEHDGLLMIVEEATGEVKERQVYNSNNDRDDVIKGIAQLSDGGFYLVGTSIQKKETLGFVIRTDEFGRTIKSDLLGRGHFQHVVALEDNSILIGGKKELDDGNVMLVQYDGRDSERLIGNSIYKTLEGMILAQDGTILLCGNTAKSKEADMREGNVWLAKINPDGTLINERIIKGKGWSEIVQARGTYDDMLLIAGEKVENRRDAWILEVDSNLKTTMDEPFGEETDERGLGVLRTYSNRYFLTNLVRNYYRNQAFLLQGIRPTADLILEPFDQFQINEVLYTFQKHFILAGQSFNSDGYSIKLVSLEEGSPMAYNSKGLPELEIVRPPYLRDQNGDGVLAPRERASIDFRIRNAGVQGLSALKVFLKPSEAVSSISYNDFVFVSHIRAGGEKQVSLAFNPDELFVSSNFSFSGTIIVEDDRKNQLLKKAFRLGGERTPTGNLGNIIIDWDERSTSRRTTEGSAPIRARIYSDKALKQQDVKVYVNGSILEDSKGREPIASKKNVSGGTFSTDFVQQIALTEGRNVIFIEVNGKSAQEIVIEYQPQLPNLHVLAIGPTYDDLQYTSQDAKDFANIMRSQKGKGLFNDVVVTELTTESTTTTQSIRAAFENLYNRFIKMDGVDKIASNDVLVVFISSHGKKINDAFKIVPSDFSEDRALTTTVDYKYDVLERFLKNINCKKLVFMDACHSGAAKNVVTPAISRALNRLNATSPGLVTMSSCGDAELSYEDRTWENGAFTEALLEALSGKAVRLSDDTLLTCDNPEDIEGLGILSIKEIYSFLQKRVPDLVKQKYGSAALQTPFMPADSLDQELNLFIIEQ